MPPPTWVGSALWRQRRRSAARGPASAPTRLCRSGRTTNTFQAVSGRIGALAVRNDGTIILGAAQGGVWTYDEASGTWTSRTNDTDTQSVGALAIAPSNDNIVYLGSGEGALSGDSYYGDGVYKSADGGLTWSHVSGSFFQGNSTSDIVVDPSNADHVYIATLRGRGGIRRTTPPSSQPYGIWESTDGGASWTLLKGTTSEFAGATDLVMDPLAPNILWASFWGDAIYRSTNGGKSWSNAERQPAAGAVRWPRATRFSLGISHLPGARPACSTPASTTSTRRATTTPARCGATTAAASPGSTCRPVDPATDPDSILDYCTHAVLLRQRGVAGPGEPGHRLRRRLVRLRPVAAVGRDLPQHRRWADLEEPGLRPAPRLPRARVRAGRHQPRRHRQRRRRLAVAATRAVGWPARAPLSATDWENLNGQVNPATAALVHSTGLRITQFTSMATVPDDSRAVLGRHAGQRHPTQVDCERSLVRPAQR